MINLKNKTSLFTLKKIFSLFFILLLFSFYFNISNANNKKEFVQHKNVSLEIISSVNSIGNEDKIYLGLRYKLNPGWKIYWKYPGKAGYPPEINWIKSGNSFLGFENIVDEKIFNINIIYFLLQFFIWIFLR